MLLSNYFDINRKDRYMKTSNLQEGLAPRAGELLAAILLIQPLLDVLSYFMQQFGSTAFTTALRMALLVAVSLLGFGLSGRKKPYLICFGAIGGFWLLHSLNCLRLGYADPVGDAAEYCKLIQFPLWTLSFVTLLQCREDIETRAAGLLAVNLGTVLLVIALSYAAGMPAYTYDIPSRDVKIGLLGWFAIPNTQSAIVSMLVIGALLWAYSTGRLWVFCVACVPGFGLLYFTGTRLAYYSALIMALGFFVLVLIPGGRMRLCCVPLLIAIALFIGFKGASIMEYRQTLTADSFRVYQEPADEIMGEDRDYEYQGGEVPPEIKEKIAMVYEDVYGGLSFAGTPLLGDLLDRFGVQRVMEAYGYTTKASTLYSARPKKLTVASLVMEEQDFVTRLLGLEASSVVLNGTNYDPENDFPALICYYGYLGTGLYVCFAGYFILAAARSFLKGLRSPERAWLVGLGAWTMMLVLGLGSAQFSGQVLRKPSATVYMSLAAAQLYLLVNAPAHGKPRVHFERRAGLTIKQSPVK